MSRNIKPIQISIRKLAMFQRRNKNVSSMEEAHNIFKTLPQKTQDVLWKATMKRALGLK